MKTSASPAKAARIGPYSRALQNGASNGLDGRTVDGKFVRRCEAELLAQLVGEPSFAQRLLVRRVAKMMLVAEKLDGKITGGGDWTPHDARTFGGLNNAISRALKDLGLRPQPSAKLPSLVARVAQNWGYSLFSLTRASVLVNCQSALA